MAANEEIEAKPVKPGDSRGDRPLSWSERVEQRKRKDAEASGLNRVAQGLLARVGVFSRSIGLSRRKHECEGVVYRERSNTSLRRSLSVTGSGVKEYDVRFHQAAGEVQSLQYPVRETMRIRYTHHRIFADLGHDPRIGFVEQIQKTIRPGDRVLELGCGTGGGSEKLAELVGPSGGVVALQLDGESIRFARQRYRRNHLAYELGWLETLEGELDSAFDAIIAVDLFRDAPDDPSKSRAIASLWRVLAPGGGVTLICSDRRQMGQMTDRLLGAGSESVKMLESDPALHWDGAIARKPERTEAEG